jgi:hypothetical protein
MKAILRILSLLIVCICSCPASAATVRLAVEDLGDDFFRFHYSVSGFEFLRNQELAIDFDPELYLGLSNAAVPEGFDVLLFQPSDPPGAFGRYSAAALIDVPVLSGPFSVDVRTVPSWSPGVQNFAINQLDEQGVIVSTIATGVISFVPEPATWELIAAGMLIMCGVPAALRRLRRAS